MHWRMVASAVRVTGSGFVVPIPHRCLSARPSSGSGSPPEIIVLAVRWHLRYGLSYRDVEELLGERGIEVDHVTIYR